jgi:hypothetical protein
VALRTLSAVHHAAPGPATIHQRHLLAGAGAGLFCPARNRQPECAAVGGHGQPCHLRKWRGSRRESAVAQLAILLREPGESLYQIQTLFG